MFFSRSGPAHHGPLVRLALPGHELRHGPGLLLIELVAVPVRVDELRASLHQIRHHLVDLG